MERPEQPQPGPSSPDERKPLLFGCILLLIAVVVLGGAFIMGAWSMAQGYGPP